MNQKYESSERIAKNNSCVRINVLRLCIIMVLSAIFFVGFNQFTYGQAWYNPSWGYRKAITIDFTKIPNTDQANFPVLVNLSSDAGLSAHALNSGNDILFTSSDGTTQIPYGRELYTSGTGALVAWVKVSTLSHTANTIIYLYYGNPSATDQQQGTSVWDANYKLVYHLGDASSPAADATSNGNNGTASAGVTFGATGQIGKATSYGAASRNISAASSVGIGSTSNFTYEVWINVTSFSNNTNMTSANGSYWIDRAIATNALVSLIPAGGRFGWQVRDDNGNNLGGPNAGSIVTGTWQHVVLVRDITNNLFRLYLNGVQQTTIAFSGVLPLTPPTPRLGSHVTFGSPAFLNGSLDEFRVSGNARSADWIAAEYNNQSSPSTFYSVGAEALVPPAITGFNPATGCANTIPVIITGTNFTGATAVKFGGTNALSFTVNSATQITATPASGTTGTISVTTANGTGTSASGFTVNSLPAASATKTDISCFGANNGTIVVNGSGGSGTYSFFSINNGGNYQAGNTFGPLPIGVYPVRVKDSNGCESKQAQ